MNKLKTNVMMENDIPIYVNTTQLNTVHACADASGSALAITVTSTLIAGTALYVNLLSIPPKTVQITQKRFFSVAFT